MEATPFVVRFYVDGELDKESRDIMEVIDITLQYSTTHNWDHITVHILDDNSDLICANFQEFFLGMTLGIGKSL